MTNTYNTPSSLTCFKNGFVYVNIPVKINNDPGHGIIKECKVGPLPSFVVNGTVELEADNPDELKILSIAHAPTAQKTKPPELKIPSQDLTWVGFLEANMGNCVGLTLVKDGGEGQEHIEGVCLWVQGELQEPRLAVLQTPGEKSVLLDCSKIVHIETCSNHTGESHEENIKFVSVRYKTEKSSGEAHRATLSYLTKGLTWAPSYTLLLNKTENTLKLTGKACLISQLPFHQGGVIPNISLISGQPRIEYQNQPDPLVSGYPGGPRFRGTPGARDEFITKNFLVEECEEESTDDLEERIRGGEYVEDFYHYKLDNVPLKQNQPLSIPFIKDCPNIKYEDIYEIKVSRHEVLEAMHAITFKIISGQPLTSAPVTILAKKTEDENDGDNANENNFLVQGMMKFTPTRKSATVQMTKAMHVDGKFLVETSSLRKTELISEGPILFGGSKKYADSIEKNAKIIVNNNKDEDIKCKILYNLYGHLVTSSHEPVEKTERPWKTAHSLNPTINLVWQMIVPKGGTSQINFTFCVKEWNNTNVNN